MDVDNSVVIAGGEEGLEVDEGIWGKNGKKYHKK